MVKIAVKEVPDCRDKPIVDEVSKAHLDPREQEVELGAVKDHGEEQQGFNTGLKEKNDRMLEKSKEVSERIKLGN
ncbi:hypothetical protein TNCV_341311 [Trichonephila clavipes]|nr:hypothetical protein TNCV_341311 [Trichonephila clavipes]